MEEIKRLKGNGQEMLNFFTRKIMLGKAVNLFMIVINAYGEIEILMALRTLALEI